jgi:hypothetical protein
LFKIRVAPPNLRANTRSDASTKTAPTLIGELLNQGGLRNQSTGALKTAIARLKDVQVQDQANEQHIHQQA